MSIPSTLISGFIGLASCGYMGARILHSLWLIEVDPHRGGSISLRPFALSRPVPQGVELGAQSLAYRGCDGREFPGELVERVAEAVAEAHPREERAHALDGAIEPIREDAPHPIGGLVKGRRTLKLPIGQGKGCSTGLLGVAQMPEHAATHNRGQIDLVG